MAALPENFKCPITQTLMKDPVMDKGGHNFEKEAILRWLKRNKICPMSREPITEKELFPNRELKERIKDWIRQQSSQPTSTPIVEHQISRQTSKPWEHYNLVQDEYDYIFAQFLTFDVDDTNELSKRELTKLCTWLNYPHAPKDINDMFAQMDIDGNGTIDFDEFVSYIKDKRPHPEFQYNMTQAEYEKFMMTFHYYDTDGNGGLDRDEFRRLVKAMKYPGDPEQIFREIDLDSNGLLDVDEFLTYWKKKKEAVHYHPPNQYPDHQHYSSQPPPYYQYRNSESSSSYQPPPPNQYASFPYPYQVPPESLRPSCHGKNGTKKY